MSSLYPTFEGYPSLSPLLDPANHIPPIIPSLAPSTTPALPTSFPLTTPAASLIDTSTHAALLPLTVCPSAPLLEDDEPRTAVIRDIFEFIPERNRSLSPAIINPDSIADEPVLSEGLLQSVDQLSNEAFENYHPWFILENHPIYTLIQQMVDEAYPKLIENAMATPFKERLKICERVIFETSRLSTLSYHNKGIIEVGLRYALAQRLIPIEATQIGVQFTYPGNGEELCNDLEKKEHAILEFSSRGYFFHCGITTSVFDSLLANVGEKVQSGIIQRIQEEANLPFDEKVSRCNQVIQTELDTLLPETLRRHVLTPASKALGTFQPLTYRAAAQMLVTENAPLFKTAFEQGRPLPAPLEGVLNSLYTLASNNNSYYLLQDPRTAFIEAVFGTTDITALQERVFEEANQETTTLEASVPNKAMVAFFKRLLKQAPSAAQVAIARQQIDERHIAKSGIVRELQNYIRPAAPTESLSSVITPSTTDTSIVVDTSSPTLETAPQQPISEITPPSLPTSEPEIIPPITPPAPLPRSPAITTPLTTTITPPAPLPRSPAITTPLTTTITPPAPLPRSPATTTPPVMTRTSSSSSSSAPARTTPRSSPTAKPPEVKPSGSRVEPKPMVSYAHIAFNELLERGLSGDALYKELSTEVKRDVMRHLFFISLKGPVETSIEAAFIKKVNRTTVPHVNALYDRELIQLGNKIPKTAGSENAKLGEEILNDYYAGKQNSVEFKQKLDNFATDARFLGFFQDQAIAANVKTSAKDWASNNYKKSTYVHLTIQALERYLHTA